MNQNLKLTAAGAVEIYRSVLEEVKVSHSSFAVLCMYADFKESCAYDIKDHLGIKVGSIRKHLSDLHNEGLLRRIGRGVYTITQDGAELIEEILPDTYLNETNAS